MNPSIAIFLQHYLSPSMTFIYRQLMSLRASFKTVVLCSHKIDNLDLFTHNPIYYKVRNNLWLKENYFFTKIYSPHKLLSTNPKLSSYQIKYFKEKLIENKVNLIHAHFGPSGIEILPIAKEMKIPLVVTFHGYDASILLKNNYYIKNVKKLFDYAQIVTVSYSMEKELRKYGLRKDKVRVVRCGVPIDKFKYHKREPLRVKLNNKSKIIFLQVSNFVEKKGHRYTVEAFELFLRKFPFAHLILAGGGELFQEIKNLVKIKGLLNHISFTGTISENQVNNLMKKSDVFLHHSVITKKGDKEGIPTVIMEAMATGLPVISTFHSGIPELIENGRSGYLVTEKDVASYSQKMYEVLFEGDNFRKEARRKIESDFNLVLEIEKLKKLYIKTIQ